MDGSEIGAGLEMELASGLSGLSGLFGRIGSTKLVTPKAPHSS